MANTYSLGQGGCKNEDGGSSSSEMQAKLDEIALNFVGELWMRQVDFNAKLQARLERLARMRSVD